MDEPKVDEWLFEVEGVFDLRGEGLIIVFDLGPSGAVLRVGDALTFLCADGQEIESHIKSFALINPDRSRELTTIVLRKAEETRQITAGAQAFRRSPGG